MAMLIRPPLSTRAPGPRLKPGSSPRPPRAPRERASPIAGRGEGAGGRTGNHWHVPRPRPLAPLTAVLARRRVLVLVLVNSRAARAQTRITPSAHQSHSSVPSARAPSPDPAPSGPPRIPYHRAGSSSATSSSASVSASDRKRPSTPSAASSSSRARPSPLSQGTVTAPAPPRTPRSPLAASFTPASTRRMSREDSSLALSSRSLLATRAAADNASVWVWSAILDFRETDAVANRSAVHVPANMHDIQYVHLQPVEDRQHHENHRAELTVDALVHRYHHYHHYDALESVKDDERRRHCVFAPCSRSLVFHQQRRAQQQERKVHHHPHNSNQHHRPRLHLQRLAHAVRILRPLCIHLYSHSRFDIHVYLQCERHPDGDGNAACAVDERECVPPAPRHFRKENGKPKSASRWRCALWPG
ncbi:hypothetical protein B0H16DRAFT_1799493 [Mycena metata]|uniref:Uncharacterized protein n=1 Tax=Mycena metata TaxID=1033252 RepID=A0AAD7N8D9_9AGAR|nr:hypothetical protein B0H16DRAFT_1724293 [Mycena metata]KAJ7764205.1 hypothetical protein B0H16DRAFT_1799493 [Mycena metata]